MADEETLKSPKYASALLTMRALLPAVYVRTDNPGVIPRLANDIFKGRWGFFHSTDPNIPAYQVRSPESSLYHAGQRFPVKNTGHSPLEVITATAACNPLDEQGFTVIQIEEHGVASNTVPDLATKLDEIIKRRFTDPRWMACVWFVGTLPPYQAVPEGMRDDIYPVDLLVGTRHKGEEYPDGRTYDYARKAGMTNPEEIQKLLKEQAGFMGLRVESPSAYKPYIGLTRSEIMMSVNLSCVNTRKTGRTMFDPVTLDSVRHRWTRLG